MASSLGNRNMTNVVRPLYFDLCDDDSNEDYDESYKEVINVEDESNVAAAAAASGVARAPLVVDDSDHDDDDDDYRIPTRRPKRRRNDSRLQQEGLELIDSQGEGDKKPAAKARKKVGDSTTTQRSGARRGDPPAFVFGQQQQSASARAAPRAVVPKGPLDTIQEVFPDVDRTHANNLLYKHSHKLEMVMSVLAEGGYPKRKNAPTAAATRTGLLSSSLVVRRPHALPKYDYLAPSAFEPSPEYCQQAHLQILYEFPFLSQKALRDLCKSHDSRYSIVRTYLFDKISGKNTDEATSTAAAKKETEEQEEARYRELQKVLTSKRLTRKQKNRVGFMSIQKPRTTSVEPEITDPILKDELLHSQHKLQEWMSSVEERLARKEARKHSQLEGSAMECACCFDNVAMEEMVACREEGHLFCVGCIKDYAESQIFGSGNLGTDKRTKKPALELLCCHGSGCQSGFHEAHLQKALPYKTLEKYTQMQFQASVAQAGLGENLCTCPKCGFQADLPETEMIFRCPMEDCQYESCRKCGKEPHIPLRCDEVEKVKHQDAGRLKVEEAITAAKIRTCPKCKTSFVKSEGCNKMSCPCGVKMCYICREVLDKRDPYKHFCQTPHCKHKRCGQCTLYSDCDEDDKRAMREAGISAAEMYKHELSTKEDAPDISIDVDGILR